MTTQCDSNVRVTHTLRVGECLRKTSNSKKYGFKTSTIKDFLFLRIHSWKQNFITEDNSNPKCQLK